MTPVSVYLGDIDITDKAATLDIVDDGSVEMMIPVQLGALGWLCIRFEG